MKPIILATKYSVGLAGLFLGSVSLAYLSSLIYQLTIELGLH